MQQHNVTMHPKEGKREIGKINNEFNSAKKQLIALLFAVIMVCVSIISAYKTGLSIKLQEGVSNFEKMEVLHPINRKKPHIIRDKSMDPSRTNPDMYNSVIKRKKTCFYLSRKETRELNITDLYLAETNFKRNQHSTNLAFKSKPCLRIITVGTFGGRMGNHMFRIASMLGLAYRYDIKPAIPKESLLNKYIDLPNVVDLAGRMPKQYISCKSRYQEHCIKSANTTYNIILFGQMQSWKYFDSIRDIIISAFKIHRVHIINAKRFIENLKLKYFKNVCIHVRRGDFLLTRRQVKGFAVANESYIERAKTYFVQSYYSVQFISVSLDKKWCRKNIKDAILSPFANAGDDMALLSLCDHVIVTSGTFGWWGAWLSGGTVVYFKGYPAPGSQLANRVRALDYYPDRWIAM